MVFSQFTSFLDLIQAVLARDGLPWYRFDGSMDIKKRNEAVPSFKAASPEPKVLIVSLKAGGVGLNVRCASYHLDESYLAVMLSVADECKSRFYGTKHAFFKVLPL